WAGAWGFWAGDGLPGGTPPAGREPGLELLESPMVLARSPETEVEGACFTLYGQQGAAIRRTTGLRAGSQFPVALRHSSWALFAAHSPESIERLGQVALDEFVVLVVLQLSQGDFVRADLATELDLHQAHGGMGGHLAALVVVDADQVALFVDAFRF